MPETVRQGDLNDAAGAILDPLTSSVFANGILVSVLGSTVSPHIPNSGLHLVSIVIEGSPDVFAEGIEVVRVGDAENCTHIRADGSPDVLTNS